MLFKGSGALHATNITAGSGDLDGVALDGEDDIGLIRAFERLVHNDLGIVMSEWDEELETNRADLERVGVFKGDFYCLQRMDSLLGGGIWRLHCRQKAIERAHQEEIAELKAQMNLLKEKN